MRSARLVLVLAVLVGSAACSDDTDPPPAAGSRDRFCAELRDAVEADLTVFDPLRPASREDTEAATARLADAAPRRIAAAMRLLADSFASVSEVLDEVEPSDPRAAELLEGLDLDLDEISAAQAAVTDYARSACQIDLAALNAASVPTTTSTVPGTTVPPATTLPPVVETTAPPVSG
jgi:hypothetical protein